MKMTIECPGCGHRFEDRDRASLIVAAGADVGELRVNRPQSSTTTCPECGQPIEYGLLLLDDDGLWRVSEFAGHADDVTLMRPPGGEVSYAAPAPEDTGEPSGLTPAELEARGRALAAIEGRARGVPPDAQREAVELALESGVLGEAESTGARQWLESRPR